MPAIAKILIVFSSVLLLTRLKVKLGLSLVLGGISLCVWRGFSAGEVCGVLAGAVTSPELWLLLLITVLIIEIGRFVTEKRNADELVVAVERWGGRHGRAASLMALPAMIGLIPMPAGALFSAPFVARIAGEDTGSPPWKSAINYWFRHVWEYWWPLYPGVIIAAAVFGMALSHLMLVQFPFTLVAVASAYFFLVRPHVAGLRVEERPASGGSRRALFLLVPLVTVVASVFALPPVVRGMLPDVGAQIERFLAVLVGLLLAMGLIVVDEVREVHAQGLPAIRLFTVFFSSLKKRSSINVLLSLAGILIFKQMLTDSGLLPLASSELVQSGIPLVLAVAALPFLAGFVTGIALGFTGISFPLIVGLMSAEASTLTPWATLVLAYGFGYMGMMLSPVHLCLLVTKDHFGASLFAVYRQIMPCIAVVLLYSVLAHVLLNTVGW